MQEDTVTDGPEFDPITLKMLWDRLTSITVEVGRALEQGAFSIVIREGKDYVVVLTDVRGNCIAQPWDCAPSFMGTLPVTVRHFLKEYPLETLAPGDTLITNDPWKGTGHLHDFSMATPIFGKDGRPIAFAACTAHVPDIGGSLTSESVREVYEEGLLVPPMKLVEGGMLNHGLLTLISNNVRVSEYVIGDIMAMLAANNVAVARVSELFSGHDEGAFSRLCDEVLSRSENAMREAIAAVPDGVYRSNATASGPAGPYEVKVAVKVEGSAMEVDFTGSSAQTESAFNSVLAYTEAYAMYALKALLLPELPNNDGLARPVSITAAEGEVLNAQHPVAVDKRNLVGQLVPPALLMALAEVLPGSAMAESGGTPSQPEVFAGRDAKGRYFVQLSKHCGGLGASGRYDGEVGAFPSNLGSTPTEVVEAQAPVLIVEKRLMRDSGGAGRQRGGLGQRVTTRNVAPSPIRHVAFPVRLDERVRGVLGGAGAGSYRMFLDAEPHPHAQGATVLAPGQEVTVEYPGGGGFGPPSERDRAAIVTDVLDGFVSLSAARAVYGLTDEAQASTDPEWQALLRKGEESTDA